MQMYLVLFQSTAIFFCKTKRLYLNFKMQCQKNLNCEEELISILKYGLTVALESANLIFFSQKISNSYLAELKLLKRTTINYKFMAFYHGKKFSFRILYSGFRKVTPSPFRSFRDTKNDHGIQWHIINHIFLSTFPKQSTLPTLGFVENQHIILNGSVENS